MAPPDFEQQQCCGPVTSAVIDTPAYCDRPVCSTCFLLTSPCSMTLVDGTRREVLLPFQLPVRQPLTTRA
jgi:hypothetical protein